MHKHTDIALIPCVASDWHQAFKLRTFAGHAGNAIQIQVAHTMVLGSPAVVLADSMQWTPSLDDSLNYVIQQYSLELRFKRLMPPSERLRWFIIPLYAYHSRQAQEIAVTQLDNGHSLMQRALWAPQSDVLSDIGWR